MNKIFLIQFRNNKKIAKQEKECIEKIAGEKIKTKNIFIKPLLKKDFFGVSKIIIGGSGDFGFSKKTELVKLYKKIVKTFPFIKNAIGKNIDILGICLGHQYIAHLFGSEIISDKKQKEFGTFNIYLNSFGKKDPLFFNLPEKFLSQEGHEDCVKKLPKEAILLASSDRCKIESFKLKNKNVYGVQFHPELSAEDSKNRMKMINSEEKVYFMESPLVSKVIKNFVNLRQ